ncbi:MAG: acyl-CoA dehydrogenase [Candidimonas sp.]|nr:MAG: acyl-CoA dehydrogenase [Candidimonas sp.]
MAMDEDTFEQVIGAIRRFVREVMIPAEARVEEEDRIPPEILAGMKNIGLFGLTIPEEYGGFGMSMSEEAAVLFEIGQAAPAFRSAFATTVGIASQGIVLDGTPEQKQRYLPRLATGEIIGAFALTEPDAGSDAASIRTSARREGEAYLINGTKRFITNAPEAGVFTVFARTGTTDARANGISAFLVEAGTPGLSLGGPDRKMGHHGSHTCDVIFENCRVPASALLGGKEGVGFKTAMKALDRGRLHIAAASVGVAERLIGDALRYALDRRQFGKPIADFELVQAMLADCRTESYAGRCMVEDAARRRDAGEPVAGLASCCKYFCTEMVGRVADRAVQIHGGSGYMKDFRVEQFYRDVRLYRLYEGTSQIQQLIIARDMIRSARA